MSISNYMLTLNNSERDLIIGSKVVKEENKHLFNYLM